LSPYTTLFRSNLNIDLCGILALHLYEEFDDLEVIANQTGRADKCSALVKVLPDFRDVLVAHDMWGNYRTMLRVLKRYSFNFRTSKSKSVAMSSYPGLVYSADDFYITSSGLVIQETTNNDYDNRTYRLDPRKMVFEFIRNAVANRMATSGMEWSLTFAYENSGTYNNQFMIVDY